MTLAIRASIALLALGALGCSLISPVGSSKSSGDLRPVAWVYATLYSQNAILEFDKVQSRAQKDPILVPNGPRALAVDPRGRGENLYVVCELGNMVAVIDRRNRRITRSINVGSRPYGIALTPGGEKAFVTNKDDDTVSVIDLKSQSVTDTLQLNVATTTQPTQPATAPVRLQPRGIAVNWDGSRVYVACQAGKVVMLEGTPAGRYSASRNIDLMGSVAPLNVAVNPSQQEETVYVTDPQGNRLFFFNPNQGGVAVEGREFPGGPWGAAVGRNPQTGKPDRLYVTTERDNALWPMALPGLTVTTDTGRGISVGGKGPQAVSVSPQGNEIYVAVSGSNTIAMFQRTGNNVFAPELFNLNQLDPQYLGPPGDLALGGFLY